MPATPITTYDSPIGTGANREELDDIAYDISPHETPVMNGGKRDSCNAVQTDWLVDVLDAPSPDGVVEGEDTDENSPDPPTRLRNVCQITKRDVSMTGTQMAVDAAGGWDDIDKQTARRLAECKRDIESAILRVKALTVGSKVAARQTRSLIHFIPQANAVGYTVPANETAAIGAFDVGAVFTEAEVKAAMQAAYEVGGRPTKMYVSPDNKLAVAGFTGRVNEVLNVSETKVTYDVQLIQTPFGRLDVVIDQFYPSGATNSDFTLLLDPEYYGVRWLRKLGRTKMAVVGDKETWLVNGEWCVKVHNPSAHACIGYDSVP